MEGLSTTSPELYAGRVDEEANAAVTHTPGETTAPHTRSTQQQESERNLTESGAANAPHTTRKLATDASFLQASCKNSKQNYGNSVRPGGAVGGTVHRDPNASNDSVGRVTPMPPIQISKRQPPLLDSSPKKEPETAIAAETTTNVVNAAVPSALVGVGGSLAKEVSCMALTSSSSSEPVVAKSVTAAVNNARRGPDSVSTKPEGNVTTRVEGTSNKEGQQEQQQQHHGLTSTESHTNSVYPERCAVLASASASASASAPPFVSSSVSASAGLANCTRPVLALSVHLVALYKRVNETYCCRRRLEAPGPKYNNGFDDSEGHYLVLFGEEILSRYTVQEVLGKGSFGTVLRCYDEKRREHVALKITRHGLNFRTQAKLELDILLKLSVNPQLGQLVVKLLKVFDWQGHLVLVFELLGPNLFQLIKCAPHNAVELDIVRKFAYQLLRTLHQLEQMKPSPIIHCDIKPENILLKSPNRTAIRLIDFGSACYSNKVTHKYIQSRYYRSPEVILYLEYGTAIDRWSLGCVLVELHTGVPLFNGHTEAAQLALFEATLGPVPAEMLAASPKRLKFCEAAGPGGEAFRLREPPLPARPLEKIIGGPRGLRGGTPGRSDDAHRHFHDFVGRLLRYRPAERMSCHDALRHPFLEPLWEADRQN